MLSELTVRAAQGEEGLAVSMSGKQSNAGDQS